MRTNKQSDKITIRLWLVYPFLRSRELKRDGIGRFIASLCKQFLNRENITLEIWCLSLSLKHIKAGFSDIISREEMNKIKFQIGFYDQLVEKINKTNQNNSICLIFSPDAKEYEKIKIKHKVLICYDLLFYPDLLLINNINGKAIQDQFIQKINKIAGSLFVISHSKFVIEEQILRLTNIKPENTAFVYLPFVPNSAKINLFERINFSFFKLFNKIPYIIYPTRIRRYKNVEVILQALKILKKRQIEIKLLLTGKLEDFPPTLIMAEGNNLMDDIIFRKHVSNYMLNLLYQNSAMCIAPSLSEGGIAWPILEALNNNTPVIASNIPATIERLKSVGINPQKSELCLFDVYDAETLANNIEYVLNNKDKVIKKQSFLKEKLFSKDWKDVADDYINIFKQILKKNV